jgi:hypothetical protein
MDIVERLKRVKYTRERNDAPNGFSWDEPCDADDYGAEQRFVNPDGPEAADEIERLRSSKMLQLKLAEIKQTELDRLREALQELVDWQNGPPLVTYTDGWNKAMEKARAALKEVE